MLCGINLVCDVVYEAVHFFTTQPYALFTKCFGYFITGIRTLFRCEKHAASCAYNGSAKECGNNIQTFHVSENLNGLNILIKEPDNTLAWPYILPQI